jgi:hypothetical protein
MLVKLLFEVSSSYAIVFILQSMQISFFGYMINISCIFLFIFSNTVTFMHFILFFLRYYHLFGVLGFTFRLFSGGNDSSSIGI